MTKREWQNRKAFIEAVEMAVKYWESRGETPSTYDLAATIHTDLDAVGLRLARVSKAKNPSKSKEKSRPESLLSFNTMERERRD